MDNSQNNLSDSENLKYICYLADSGSVVDALVQLGNMKQDLNRRHLKGEDVSKLLKTVNDLNRVIYSKEKADRLLMINN